MRVLVLVLFILVLSHTTFAQKPFYNGLSCPTKEHVERIIHTILDMNPYQIRKYFKTGEYFKAGCGMAGGEIEIQEHLSYYHSMLDLNLIIVSFEWYDEGTKYGMIVRR